MIFDLSPVVSWFRDELQRERDRATVAQASERSARELVVELEAKLEAMTAKADEWRQRCAASVGKKSDPQPGTSAAVIEAYRLLVGDGLEWSRSSGWHDESPCDDGNLEEAAGRLIDWLDERAPGGPT